MAAALSPVRIPVAVVTVGAYRFVFGRLGLFLELAWLPLLLLLAVAIMPAWLPWLMAPDSDSAVLRLLPDVVQLAAGGLCLNAFAVRWHQMMLFPGAAAAPPVSWFRTWLWFLLYTLAFYLANLALFALVFLLSGGEDLVQSGQILLLGLAAAIALPLWLGMVRLSLLFPAAAYGRKLGPGAAWRAMRGNTWRMVACGLMAGLPLVLSVVVILGAVFTALDLQLGDLQPDDPALAPPMGLYLLAGVIDTVVNFLIVALGASILVDVYRRLVLAQES
ncbi:MAG TPA: hypothetical protein VN795_07175 [Stellaceae bacterium]|nr:hypothetical protein [Stellaceae bacterium]